MDLMHKMGWHDLNHLIEKMNKLFEEIFSSEITSSTQIAHSAFIPPMDIYETENELVITAEIPGIRQENINISIKNTILTLEGERRLEKNIQKERYRRIERNYGPFKNLFPLHVDDLGFSFFDLGLLMALPSFFSIFLRLPVGTIASQIGKKG